MINDDERDYEEEEFWRREIERESDEEWHDMQNVNDCPATATE